MSTYNNSRLITPPREDEEVYPYRRVWRSIFIESGILLALMLVAFVVFGVFNAPMPVGVRPFLNIMLALLPGMLWFAFSRFPENNVPQPRRRLATTFFISALVANAIGLPLINDFLQPEAWLSLESTVNRILGYMLTIALVQEFLKYIVLRYIVWPDYYRTRTDSVAYGAATAIGYAVVANVYFVSNNLEATPDVVTLRIFAITSIHIVGSLFMAYGLSETIFSNALSFLMPVMLVLGSLLSGLSMAMRPTFISAVLGLSVSSIRTIFGLGFAIIFYVGTIAVIFFLFDVAQRREHDKFGA